jgi:hypothetical protein
MIRLADVVARITAECHSFASVQHALTSAGQDALPSVLVSPLKMEAGDNVVVSGVAQVLQITIGVFILVDRKRDAAPGYPLANQFDDLQAEVRAALIGWTAPGASMPFVHAGGEIDRYRGDGPVTWREDFATLTLAGD